MSIEKDGQRPVLNLAQGNSKSITAGEAKSSPMSISLDVQTASVLIASASVAAGAIYYILETRHQRRMRQTEAVIRLSPWLSMSASEIQGAIASVCSTEYEGVDEYFRKYSGKPEQEALKLLGNYFEGVGLLVYRRLVEADIVYDFWGDIALSTWDDNTEVIDEMRRRNSEPRMFEYWEYLAKEMRNRKEAPKFTRP